MFSEKKWCWRFWPFDKYAYRFIPQYLEGQERKGLRFSSIGFWLPIAKYEKIKPREVHYNVSLIEPKVYTEIQPYLDVCEEAGWDLVWQLEECKIFRTREGHAPVPLETDSIVELEKVKSMEKQGLRLDCFLFICFAILMVFAIRELNWLDLAIGTWEQQLVVVFGALLVPWSAWRVWKRLRRQWHIRCWEKEGICWQSLGTLGKSVHCGVCNKVTEWFVVTGLICTVCWTVMGGSSYDMWRVIAIFIGVTVGMTINLCGREEGYPRGKKMKGVHSKRKAFAAYGVALLCLCSVFFLPAQVKDFLASQNFYLSFMSQGEEFSVIRGDAVFVARKKETAQRLWNELDQSTREFRRSLEDEYGNSEMASLEKREIWDQEKLQRRGYGEYEEAYYYPEWDRLMMRNGLAIRIMEDPKLDSIK